MTRLNGWLRLWIVLSVLYLVGLLVIAFTVSIWPTPQNDAASGQVPHAAAR